jgi:hypothetical protein
MKMLEKNKEEIKLFAERAASGQSTESLRSTLSMSIPPTLQLAVQPVEDSDDHPHTEHFRQQSFAVPSSSTSSQSIPLHQRSFSMDYYNTMQAISSVAPMDESIFQSANEPAMPQSNHYLGPNQAFLQPGHEQQVPTFDLANDSDGNASHTDHSTESEVVRAESSTSIASEDVEMKPSIQIPDANSRRPGGMNGGNRRKAPPSHLKLSSNNRIVTCAGPRSPATPAEMRRSSSYAISHRIHKHRDAQLRDQRSPAWATTEFLTSHLPLTPASPYLSSSTAEKFPDTAMDPSLTLSSPPITPHPLVYMNGGAASNYFTPPQSAPPTQTTFSASMVNQPLLTPTFPTRFNESERRPSLPSNSFVVADDMSLAIPASTMAEILAMTPTTNGDIMAEMMAVSNDKMASSITFPSEASPSGLVSHLEAMAPSFPPEPAMMAQLFNNNNPFQQAPSTSCIPSEASVSSSYPSPTTTLPEFIEYKPNAASNQSSQPAPKASTTTALQWSHSTCSDFMAGSSRQQ